MNCLDRVGDIRAGKDGMYPREVQKLSAKRIWRSASRKSSARERGNSRSKFNDPAPKGLVVMRINLC